MSETRVLIVEDDPDFATSLELALGLIGISPVKAGSAEDAVQLCAEHGQAFDIAFFDVKLPGKDVIECLADLGRMQPGMTGVVMTGFRDQELFDRARNAGAVEILQKPFRMAEFLDLVKNHTQPG